jgi:hypothetical protein
MSTTLWASLWIILAFGGSMVAAWLFVIVAAVYEARRPARPTRT